jgi:catechol O-methyltransferase
VVAHNVKLPDAPKYRDFLDQQQGKVWNTIEDKAHGSIRP